MKYLILLILIFSINICYGDINLDTVIIPASGNVELKADTTYTITKTKDLKNCDWVKVGDGANPIINYVGSRDSGALSSTPGNTPTISNIDVIGSNWTYAFFIKGGLVANDVHVSGGAGVLRTMGAVGVTTLENCSQEQTSTGYIVYIGPIVTNIVVLGKSISYTEKNTNTVNIINCNLDKGSTWLSGVRCQGVDNLLIDDTVISDTVAQSEPGSVAGAALRLHHGGIAIVKNSRIFGDVFFGPLDAGDGGINLPAGSERNFANAKRWRSISIDHTEIDARSITISAGILSAKIKNSTISVNTSSIFNAHFPYMNRPISSLSVENSKLVGHGTAPTAVGGQLNYSMKTSTIKGGN